MHFPFEASCAACDAMCVQWIRKWHELYKSRPAHVNVDMSDMAVRGDALAVLE
jgi:hypothetical protein